MAKLVSKTYGDALFAVASESGRVDEFFEAAKMVSNVLHANEEFGRLLKHPKITKDSKIQMLEETWKDQIPKEMLGVMVLMITKGRAAHIVSVMDYFIDFVKEEKKIGRAHVTTAIALNEEQRKKIENKLLETTKYQTFEMTYDVDETLIGGMVIRIGDRVVDSSIKTKLYQLSRELKKIQV